MCVLSLCPLTHPQAAYSTSSASSPLQAVFRQLAAAHGAPLATKTKDALAAQLGYVLVAAEALGRVSVPVLPPAQRDPYTKQLLVTLGLVQAAATVARNAPAMLLQVRGSGVCGGQIDQCPVGT